VVYPGLVASDTSYILVTDEMRSKFFSRSDQGILFLLQNSERFVEVKSTEQSTLWYFIRPS
jgi:hypothetical protein